MSKRDKHTDEQLGHSDEDKREIRDSELDGVTLEDGFGGNSKEEVELNFGEIGRGVVN